MNSARSTAEGGVDEAVRARFFPSLHRGVLVDVGAGRPYFLSNSALFRAIGWRILAIEPNPSFCAEHRAEGHEILQYACSDHDQDSVTFSIVNSGGAAYGAGHVTYESFSSISIKDSYRALHPPQDVTTITVNVRKLDTILREHAPEVTHIDVLSVDVEGWELEVLRGLTLATYRPTVLIIENLFGDAEYVRYMRLAGYCLWMRRPPNDVYVAAQALTWRERLRAALGTALRAAASIRGSRRSVGSADQKR